MGSIPMQIARDLPANMLRLSTRVESMNGLEVQLADRQTIQARAIVLAVDAPAAALLTGGRVHAPKSNSTTCFYYAATQAPISESIIVLNGDGSGPISSICVPSNVVSTYAPSGQSLISVSVSGQKASASGELEQDVRKQLREWYGSQVEHWRLLRSYYIQHALPNQPVHFRDTTAPASRLANGLYHCGDYCETASIHGAMVSGRKAAEAVLLE